MINEIMNKQNEECMGGFIATYADAIMAHVNPGKLHGNDIAIIIKSDKTVWAKKVAESDSEWLEISRDDIKRKTSPIMKKACFFAIKKGDLFGTYLISEDMISNDTFTDVKSYLDFITE